MIQDIAPHKLNNAYDPARKPDGSSLIVHFRGRELLCSIEGDLPLSLPDYQTFCQLASICMQPVHSDEQTGVVSALDPEKSFYYLFSLDGKPVFLAAFDGSFNSDGRFNSEEDRCCLNGNHSDSARNCSDPVCFTYRDINLFRTAKPKEMAYAAVTAFHLSTWYHSSLFCGCCGTRTVHDSAERMMRCPKCGNMIFPKIMPSVIVAVINGDRILLTRYNRPGSKLGALVAGFTEIGESVEDTVHREVMEECGLRVKDLVFYKTQPWGISGGGLLAGFWCRVDGDDTIRVDGTELAEGRWVDRTWLQENYQDAGIALTGEMISVFARDPQFVFDLWD